ncbi:hypothetical protein HMPREF9120_00823, partial [Neisseria sp. oral taxon 020 str. F0370]
MLIFRWPFKIKNHKAAYCSSPEKPALFQTACRFCFPWLNKIPFPHIDMTNLLYFFCFPCLTEV